MSLPYGWHPTGAAVVFRTPEPGALVAFEHAVYRVVEVREKADDEHGRTVRVRVRPVGNQSGDPVKDAADDLHLAAQPHTAWSVFLDEHYPVCAVCREPMPCREQMAERVSEQAARKFDRYSTAGVCPACEEPVTARQKSITWDDNAVVPGGPPVTFHLRRACWGEAIRYETKWVALDPGARKAIYTCGGHVRYHGDGTYDCTEGVECPGAQARHPSYVVCDCPGHNPKGCTPPLDAKRVDTT